MRSTAERSGEPGTVFARVISPLRARARRAGGRLRGAGIARRALVQASSAYTPYRRGLEKIVRGAPVNRRGTAICGAGCEPRSRLSLLDDAPGSCGVLCQ